MRPVGLTSVVLSSLLLATASATAQSAASAMKRGATPKAQPSQPPSLEVNDPMPAPGWALLERHVLREMARNAARFVEAYTRPDGTLVWRDDWPGMEGADDAFENFHGLPLLVALGADPQLDKLARRQWEAMARQFTKSGQLKDEWYRGYDWMHHSEGSHILYYLALSDPTDTRFRERALRFARLYMTAPNWDAERKLIRSPINGSDGPERAMTIADWSEHRKTLAKYLLPYDDVPGVESSDAWLDDTRLQKLLDVMNARMMPADVPLNLMATSLITHAFMLTGDAKYKTWVLDYTRAWIDRTKQNKGILPDNVGPTGKIGETMDGKWWGGYYGWRWPHGIMNIFDSTLVAAGNCLLLTGDRSFLAFPRSQQDLIRGLGQLRGGRMLFPNRYKESGWYDHRSFPPKYPTHLWNLSQDAEDWQRLMTLPDSEGWAEVENSKSKWDGDHEGPWLRFLAGELPDYPQKILQVNLEQSRRRMHLIATDKSDPKARDVEHWLARNPVVLEGLVQLMLGSPNVLFHGGLLHARLRYFDPARRRAGLPEDVAALVDGIEQYRGAIRVTLVNLDQGAPREVLIQAGTFGEHRFERASIAGRPPIPLGHKHVTVRLAPGAGVRVELEMARHVGTPSYAFPWHAPGERPKP
jgi:hypothetical protein